MTRTVCSDNPADMIEATKYVILIRYYKVIFSSTDPADNVDEYFHKLRSRYCV